VVRQDGGGWKIEVADDWQRPMWGGSSSRGTGEPYCHSELMEDSLRNIEPVQFGAEQMCQASVELPHAVLLTTRAAAFSKRCSLSVMVLGDPANAVLQPSMRDVMKAWHARESSQTQHQVIVVFFGSDAASKSTTN